MTDTALGPEERRPAGAAPGPTTPAQPVQRAEAASAAVEGVTQRLVATANELDDLAVRGPSLLPGWTRAHVLSHLARNADACRNLLVWARTGVQHSMYASAADRDADIEEGSRRGAWLLSADLSASCERFSAAVRSMPDEAWSAEVVLASGLPMPAHSVLRLRLLETWVHLVDLDVGVGFGDIPMPELEWILEDVVQEFGGRADVPPLCLTVPLPDGRRREWDLRGALSKRIAVSGPAGPVLGWLLGRTDGAELSGQLPALPTWL